MTRRSFRFSLQQATFAALLLSWMLPFSVSATTINPDPPPTGTCPDCEKDSSSGDPADADNYSVDLTLNVGRAPMERPGNYSSLFVVSGENLDEPSQPQTIRGLDAQFEGSEIAAAWPAQLRLKSAVINAACFSPASLTYKETFKMEVLKSGTTVRQLLTGDFLVDIQALPSGQQGFVAKWWRSSSKGSKSGGFYVPSGDPVKMVTVSNPNPFASYTALDVAIQQVMPESTTRAIHYRYVFSANSSGNVEHRLETWTKKPGESGAVQIAANDIEFLSGAPVGGVEQNNQDRIRTIKQADLSGSGAYGSLTTLSRIREIYADIGGKKRLVASTRLSSTTNNTTGLKTTYGYYNTPTDTLLHGRQRWQKNPDGSWKIWNVSVTPSTQIVTEYSPFKDGTFVLADDGSNIGSLVPGQTRAVTTTVTATTMTRIEMVLGILNTRTEKDLLTGSGGERVTRIRDYYTGSSYFETYRAFNPYGDGSSVKAGRIAWETHRDGTASVYGYPAAKQVTVATGRAIGSGQSSAPVVNTAGTITARTYNAFWEPILETVTDIASDEVISMSAVTDEDLYGRPEKVEFNGNPADYQTTTYGCCGPLEKRDRSGAVTITSYDLLKRVYKISTRNSLAATPVITATDRTGLTTAISISAGEIAAFGDSKRELNLLGEVVKRWDADADGQTVEGEAMELTTIVTEYPAGGGRKVTETDPLGGIRITTSYRDGRTKSFDGTGVHAESYDYGAHSYNGGGLWTKTTCANGTEWVMNFEDKLGRPIRSQTPDGGYSLKTYYGGTAAVGARGLLASETDFDQIATPGSGTQINYSYGYNTSNQSFVTVTEQLPDNQARVTTTTSGVVGSVTLHGKSFGPAAFETTALNGITTSETFQASDGYGSGRASFGRQTLEQRTVANDGSWTVTVTNPDGTASRSTYDDGHLVLAEQFNSLGTATMNRVASKAYTYDELGRVQTTWDSRIGSNVINGYRDSGAMVSFSSNGDNDTTTYTHDARGRVIATTLPDNSVSHVSYAPAGEVQAAWGSKTNPTFRTYDGHGRLVTLRTNPTLNGSGVPTDVGGSVTTWVYSPTRGWLVEKNYHGENDDPIATPASVDYEYTLAGRVKSRIQERGVVTTYSYDRGILKAVTYSNDSTNTPGLAYSYDAFGRLRTVTQGSGGSANTHTYAYKSDSDGNGGTLGVGLDLHSEIIQYGASGLTRTLIHHQDSAFRDTGYQLLNGTTVEHAASYGYDTAGRLQNVDPSYPLPGNPSFTYGYTSGSRGLVGTVTGPAHTVTNTWENNRDVLDSKTNRETVGTASDVSVYDYTVNVLGQRTAVSTSGSAMSSAYSLRWDYNSRGEVTTEDYGANASNDSRDRVFQYDPIGNREKTAAGALTLPGTQNYSANALNQYNLVPGGIVPGYDLDGNAIDYPLPVAATANAALLWDAESRLVKITRADATVIEYAYDYVGRRIRKTVGGGQAVHAIYDGWNLVAEYDGTTLSKAYTWGMDLSGTMQRAGGVGGMLAVKEGTAVYYPAYDGNGNVSDYLDGTGISVAHYEYDAFGNIVSSGGTKVSDFAHRFSTKPRDAESGFYYYGYRYYDPASGRWLSRDPSEEGGGINLYANVANDLVNKRDFLGLKTISDSAWEPDPNPEPDGSQVGGGENPLGYSGAAQGRIVYPDNVCKGTVQIVLQVSANGNTTTNAFLQLPTLEATHQQTLPEGVQGPPLPPTPNPGEYFEPIQSYVMEKTIKLECEKDCCSVNLNGNLKLSLPGGAGAHSAYLDYTISLTGETKDCKYTTDESKIKVEFRAP